jgi:hypothetical protein
MSSFSLSWERRELLHPFPLIVARLECKHKSPPPPSLVRAIVLLFRCRRCYLVVSIISESGQIDLFIFQCTATTEWWEKQFAMRSLFSFLDGNRQRVPVVLPSARFECRTLRQSRSSALFWNPLNLLCVCVCVYWKLKHLKCTKTALKRAPHVSAIKQTQPLSEQWENISATWIYTNERN